MNLSDPSDVLYSIGNEHTQIENNPKVSVSFPPPYKHDCDGSYRPSQISRQNGIERIKQSLRDLRYHSGIEKYPYEGGIEDLRTTLVCTLNCLLDLMVILDGNQS